MKATLFIRKEHEAIRSLFERYKASGARNQNGRAALIQAIRRDVSIHSNLETQVFYPELKNTASTRVGEIVQSALDEHESIDNLLSEISGLMGNEKQLDARMTQLMDEITRHMDFEEEQILEEARQHLSEHKLEELGLEMEDRRRLLTRMAA